MSDRVGFALTRQQSDVLASGRPGEVTLRVELPAGVEPDTVRAQLSSTIARHEVLRTTFPRPAGLTTVVQVVNDDLPIGWDDAALDPTTGPVISASLVETGTGAIELRLRAIRLVADLPTLELLVEAALGIAGAADPIQYAEYAAWQAEHLDTADSAVKSAAEQVWARLAIDGLTTVTVDGVPAAAAGPVVELPVRDDAAAAIASFADAADLPRRSVWLAAWLGTVQRVTGDDPVKVRVELDPRVDPELAGAAGPYTRAGAVAASPWTGGTTLADLARTVDADEAEALRYFEFAPPHVTPERLPFAFSSGQGGGSTDEPAVELRVSADGASAVLRAPGQPIADFGRSLVESLATFALAAAAGGPLAEADVLTPQQAQRCVEAGFGESDPTALVAVIEQILAGAEASSDVTAVTDGATSLTYRQLVDAVEALAGRLVSSGLRPGEPVGLVLERSVSAVVALLAVQRAGSPYVPLDAEQPPSRTAQQVESASCRMLITDRDPGFDFPGITVRLEPSESVPATAANVSTAKAELDDLAYLMFTSGSTGTPKAVAVTHRNLANYVRFITRVVGDGRPGRTWVMVSSLVTDLGLTCLYPALVSGGTLALMPASVARDPAQFAEFLQAQGGDILKITPSHLEALLTDAQSDVLPKDVLFLGGEASNYRLIDAVTSRGSCRIYNHYGPTETTVGALTYPVPAEDPHGARPTVPIGRPIANAMALVVDPNGRLLPDGAVGELAIGGAGVADGYWQRPVETAERFRNLPALPQERMYLTGDLTRRLSDGALEFLGRRDGQLKVRGFRVERGEIEAVLRQQPNVHQAAVVLQHNATGPQLVAFFVAQAYPSPTPEELARHAAIWLPDYMQPAAYVELDELPLRPNGKLDEAALAQLRPVLGRRDHQPPAGRTETRLAEIFAEVLSVEGVGATDDFFGLGGHSLLAVRVTVLIRDRLGVQLPVYMLFEAPTVRDLAAAIDSADNGLSDEELQAIVDEVAALTDEEAIALLAAEASADDSL
jgi:amino acid adenylation domain-containing protein